MIPPRSDAVPESLTRMRPRFRLPRAGGDLPALVVAVAACLVLLALVAGGCGRTPEPPTGAPASPTPSATAAPAPPSAEFLSLMNAGKNFLDQGELTNALATYRQAAALVPNDPDVHLNLANVHLAAGAATDAIREAAAVLALDPNSAAAYFVQGSAHLRLAQAEAAAKALENSRRIDPSDTAAAFQLGRAHMDLGQWDAAITAFREGIAMDPNHLHATAHYLLGQALLRAGRTAEGQQELQQHQTTVDAGGAPPGTANFERSKFTQARVPFRLEQPDAQGLAVSFVDATRDVLGEAARDYSGPIALVDANHTGANSLFLLEKGESFRLLWNSNGRFLPQGPAYPATPGNHYSAALVGDLQNDRFEDVIVLGDRGCQLFKFATNGQAVDVSKLSRLHTLAATDGALADLDFTGNLDLLVVNAPSNNLRVLRQFGPLLFTDITATSGVPAAVTDARSIVIEDWNHDDLMDVVVSRAAGPPLLLEKQRGGPLAARDSKTWAPGTAICTGDFDNDLRPDLAVAGEGMITICYNGGSTRTLPAPGLTHVRQLVAVDYDNDGWLDLWAVGDSLRAWRNAGLAAFPERTRELGLDRFDGGPVASLRFADFDQDCDLDAVVALAGGGLRYLRNDGAHAQSLVKIQLFGNRSNASGLGCKIEIETGGLRVLRTVQCLPVQVGVGNYQKLDSFLVHWFNWPQGSVDVPVNCQEPQLAVEAAIQEGSCPYLYAWDGKIFRFVTDILGAAPLGLPVSDGHYVGAAPEELVWIAAAADFPPRNGSYEVRITEELREVLYLDEAKLAVVDHPPETEIHSTDKLLPGPPFPKGTLALLHHEHPLLHAETLDGQDATAALRNVDGQRASPPKLRNPQLRGLAESHGWILDFGPLDVRRPLVLVMNGWLRFGGGMANMSAARDPDLPYPFPTLDAEIAPGEWAPVDVTVGAPAGKTKTILVDLDGRLRPGTRRLRLRQAFEIHWDRIALLEQNADSRPTITYLAPGEADLRFRGFSPLLDQPPDCPPTPVHSVTSPNSRWTVIPGGWCTRYGDVTELVASRDEALVLVNSGDELTLRFPAQSLPPPPPGKVRDFFLYVDGWDKDSDFHVAAGTSVEPLPHHGMNDQQYGRQERPRFPTDELHRRYNTRWVDARALKQDLRARPAAN